MSKSTRLTAAQLDAMGLEEYEPGKYRPKSKAIILSDDDDLTAAGKQSKEAWMSGEVNQQNIRKVNIVWGEDGKSKWEDGPDGKWNLVNRPDGAPPLYQMDADPVSDKQVNIDLLPRPDLIEEMADLSKYYGNNLIPESLRITVLGDPTPQQRHRHHQVKGADFVSTYDPSSKKKKEFLKACLPYKPEKPYEQPLRVDMAFYFSRPKSHYRTGKYAHILKDNAPTMHITRPDADNCAKLVKDALNKTFWKDDSYVCDLNIKKRYSENPRTEITITPL